MIGLFNELCEQHQSRCTFYEVADQHVHYYLDHGFYLLKLGEEAKIDVQNFSLQGSQNSEFRQAINKAEKNNFTFEVIPKEQVAGILPRLKVISDTWLQEKNTKEKGFSIGSFNKDYISEFSIAVVKQGEQIVAFANIWSNDSSELYSIDLMRSIKSESPNGVMDYLFSKIILWGKDQDYKQFSLGMAPLSGLDDSSHISLWNRIGHMIYQHGEYFYNFEGIRKYKDKYNPVWNSKYLACRNPLSIPIILTDIAALGSGGVTGVFVK